MNALPVGIDGGLEPAVWLPGLAPLWPLMLAAALVPSAARAPVLRLVPWAGLPALLIALLAPQTLQPLPELMLGATLRLDAPGRWLLGAVALLWLVGGRLAADWLRTPRRAGAFLAAMAGALWLPIAGDLPTVLAASVLAAYPLYGLLSGGRGARVLLVSVVIADLLILEALWLLAKGAAGLDFASLRSALTEVHGRGVVLALLLAGFGVKAGLMGLHYWLAPTLADARARQLAPVVAFTLAAGVLPWLRLLPLGDVAWPATGELLQWLALAGGVWAVAAGLLQAAPRAVIAYALSATTALWLVLLGLLLQSPGAPAGISVVFPAALSVSGLGIAGLLFSVGVSERHGAVVGRGLGLLSALLVAVAALGAASLAGGPGASAGWPLPGSAACAAVLLGASVSAAGRPARGMGLGGEALAGAVLVAAGFVMAVIAAIALSDVLPPPSDRAGDGIAVLSAILLGGVVVGLAAAPALARIPRLPCGDLLPVLEGASAGLGSAWLRFGAFAGYRRDRVSELVERVRRQAAGRGAFDGMESRLRRWSTAALLLVVAGAVVALLAVPG